MPLYEFSCDDCGQTFESIMKPYDPVQCPKCNRSRCTKLIGGRFSYTINGDNSASTRPKSK